MAHAQKTSPTTVTDIHKDTNKPSSRMMASFEEFENFFEQLRSRDWMHPSHWFNTTQSHIPMFAEGKMPKVDIVDGEKTYLLEQS